MSTPLRHHFDQELVSPPARLKVIISDGRIIEGYFSCIDSDFNLVVDQAVEFYGLENQDSPHDASKVRRGLGLTLIAGKHIVKVFKQNNSIS